MEQKEIFVIYKRRKKRQNIFNAVIIPIYVILILITTCPKLNFMNLPNDIIAFIFIGLFIVTAPIYISNWRCPNCDKHLGKGSNPTFCIECGAKLREEY